MRSRILIAAAAADVNKMLIYSGVCAPVSIWRNLLFFTYLSLRSGTVGQRRGLVLSGRHFHDIDPFLILEGDVHDCLGWSG